MEEKLTSSSGWRQPWLVIRTMEVVVVEVEFDVEVLVEVETRVQERARDQLVSSIETSRGTGNIFIIAFAEGPSTEKPPTLTMLKNPTNKLQLPDTEDTRKCDAGRNLIRSHIRSHQSLTGNVIRNLIRSLLRIVKVCPCGRYRRWQNPSGSQRRVSVCPCGC